MKTWFRFVNSHAEQTLNLGLLRSIAPLLTGVDREELIETERMFDQLLAIILKSEYTENSQVSPSDHSLVSIASFLVTHSKRTVAYLSYSDR